MNAVDKMKRLAHVASCVCTLTTEDIRCVGLRDRLVALVRLEQAEKSLDMFRNSIEPCAGLDKERDRLRAEAERLARGSR